MAFNTVMKSTVLENYSSQRNNGVLWGVNNHYRGICCLTHYHLDKTNKLYAVDLMCNNKHGHQISQQKITLFNCL